MANTYSNVDLDEIMNEVVLGFQIDYPAVPRFATVHNWGPAKSGDNARVQTVQLSNPAEAFNATDQYDLGGSNYTTEQSTIAVDVALSTHFITGFYVDDADTSKRRTPAREWALMVNEQIHKKLIDFTTTGITNGVYGAAGLTSTSANFDLDDMTTLAHKRTALKIPRRSSVLVIDPTYVTELASVTGLQDISASNDPRPLYEAQTAPRVKGFEIIECEDINGNSENLVGWIGDKRGIHVVSAQIGDPGDLQGVPQINNGEMVQYVEDYPVNGVSSGIGINVYVWRESQKRRTHYTFSWFGGKALLTSTQLGTHPISRIVSS